MAFIYNLTDTWNSGATTFAGIKMAVTNTASGASSKLLDLTVTGSTTGSFSVDRNGNAAVSGSLTLGSALSVANGGTGVTSLPAGRIPFGAGTSAFASSANLFWDSANSRLGIGMTSPDVRVTISGSTTISSQVNVAARIGANVTSDLLLGSVNGNSPFIASQGAYPLVFFTNAAERMRIGSDGTIGVNSVNNSAVQFVFGGTAPTVGAASYGVSYNQTVPAASTSSANGFSTYIGTEAASFTCGTLAHFFASQAPLGTNSAVTTQYGFSVANTLTGATNNIGFRGDIASGTGRWNFYASGTADNYFAGNVGIGVASPLAKLDIGGGGAQIRAGSDTGVNLALWQNTSGGFEGNLGSFALAFFTGANNARTEKMRIDNSGNVGIGNNAPTHKLSIGSTASIATATPDTLSLGGTYSNTNGANAKLRLFWDGSVVFGLGVSPSQLDYIVSGTFDHVFYANGSERMRVTSTGNVGIGTTSFGTSAAKVIGIANGTAPTTSPAGMGQLYVESGALKYRGSSGTVTTIAAA